jgi:hypothetical protein
MTGAQTDALTYAYDTQKQVYVVTATVDTTKYPPPDPPNPPGTCYYPWGHGLSVGEVVYISKASFDGATRFTGYFTVTEVDTQNSPSQWFKFIVPTPPNPGHSSGSSSSAYYGRLWQGGRIVAENNIMELPPTQTNDFASVGTQLGFYVQPSLFFPFPDDATRPAYPGVVWRRNTVRKVDGFPDCPRDSQGRLYMWSGGVAVALCPGLVAEEGVIDVDVVGQDPIQYPVQYGYCSGFHFFANKSSDAKDLYQGSDGTGGGTPILAPELETRIDDILGLAL